MRSGGGSFQNRGYNSSLEGTHLKRGCNLSGEGVLFTSRGGTIHAERGYYSHREGEYSSRREGGALHLERGALHVKRGRGNIIACDLRARAILQIWVWLKVWLSWKSKSH